MRSYTSTVQAFNSAGAHQVNVTTMQDRNATVALAGILTQVGWVEATGSSKRNKGEVFDSSAGRRLAIARALKNLAREMEKTVG